MQSIFEYTNFQLYLQDFFEESKKLNHNFSHRYLAAKLGIAMPNLILLVMRGKRKMSTVLTARLSRFLRLKKREAIYFESMVGFMQAKTHEQRNTFFQHMLKLRRDLTTKKIEEGQYEYFSNWYNPVIRELVTYPDFRGNYTWLANKMHPHITPGQAKASVQLLLRLGLVKRSGRHYRQLDPIISTGPEVCSLAVVNFHRAVAFLAASSYDRTPKDEHNITGCTVNLSKETFNHTVTEISEFRRRALAIGDNANKSTRVYQLNVQLFPVSNK